MKPVVFADSIGWLHPAAGSRGVVIAGAHGFEDLCSRRFLTLIARAVADRGLPALQFDYPGCGDAAGDHTAPEQVAAWTASIGSAIDLLRRETQVEDVLVVGFRLGALLCVDAIAGRDDVAGLALLAPPSTGKAYVRELTGLSRMIDAALPPHPDAAGEIFEGLQAAGFRMTAETVADLRSIDWQAALERSAVTDALILPVSVTSAISGLAERMQAAGRAVALEPFGGYSMLMCDPTANAIPQETLAGTVDWLADRAGAPVGAGVPDEPDGPGDAAGTLKGAGYEEQPVVIGDGTEICGVLCRPGDAAECEDAVLMLNAGAVPHIGWARGSVEMARALAADGIASLRIDLPGLGQSEAPPEKRLFLYDERDVGDVTRALDWLERAGYRDLTAAGTCSGAFQAFHAARQDPRIGRLIMVNPLCFAWNSSYALDMGIWKAYTSSKAALGKESEETPDADDADDDDPHSTSRLGAALGFVSRNAQHIVRRNLEFAKSALTGLSPARLMGGRPVERWMAALTRRGTQVLMVTSENDLSHEEIARHFGPDGARLRSMRGVTMHNLPAADHTLTPLHARQALATYVAEGASAASRAKSGIS